MSARKHHLFKVNVNEPVNINQEMILSVSTFEFKRSNNTVPYRSILLSLSLSSLVKLSLDVRIDASSHPICGNFVNVASIKRYPRASSN